MPQGSLTVVRLQEYLNGGVLECILTRKHPLFTSRFRQFMATTNPFLLNNGRFRAFTRVYRPMRNALFRTRLGATVNPASYDLAVGWDMFYDYWRLIYAGGIKTYEVYPIKSEAEAEVFMVTVYQKAIYPLRMDPRRNFSKMNPGATGPLAFDIEQQWRAISQELDQKQSVAPPADPNQLGM